MRRTRARTLVLPLLAVLAVGCGAEDDSEDFDLSENTAEMTVEEMGRLGARVYLAPDRADEIVTAAGLTPAEFEERVRAITDDPGRSITYAEAFEAEVADTRDAADAGEGGDSDAVPETAGTGTAPSSGGAPSAS